MGELGCIRVYWHIGSIWGKFGVFGRIRAFLVRIEGGMEAYGAYWEYLGVLGHIGAYLGILGVFGHIRAYWGILIGLCGLIEFIWGI